MFNRRGFTKHGFTAGDGFGRDRGEEEAVDARFVELKNRLQTDAPLAQLQQVHGATVVNGADPAVRSVAWTDRPTVEGDALVSFDRDVVLAVRTADCAPVLIACPTTGAVAAVHAGWKGLAKGVVRDAVKSLVRGDASPIGLLAAIGPCICEKCYEVGEDVARHFPESVDPVKDHPGKFMMELALAVEVSLITAGLTSDNIDRLDICTACGNRGLHSHRASGGNCSRQLAFICG